MDLVASYDSEADESDENKVTNSNKNCSGMSESAGSQKYDIIDLDSDSDGSFETGTENAKPSSDNTQTSSKVEPEYIDLSEEDENIKDNNSKGNTKVSSAKNAKSTDFLKLEESDSTEEDEPANVAQDKLLELKSSASVLSNVPCGPAKQSTIPVQKVNNAVIRTNVTDARVNAESSNKNLRHREIANTETQKEAVPIKEFIAIPETPRNIPDLLIEDERIIEASHKNIVCRIPKQAVIDLRAHNNSIMSLNWCIPQYSHLLLSSSLDGTIKIWDIFKLSPTQVINVEPRNSPADNPCAGLSTAKWSLDGGQIVTGGLGRKAYLYDVQTGKRIIAYNVYNGVSSIEVHPYVEDVFLVGTKNAILGFDARVNTALPVRSFFSSCKEVLDIVFLDENEFVCSTNIVGPECSDRTIMVWDFSSGAILSNQIYLECFTCPSLKVHPTDSTFVAQTNGNYIAAFSTSRPYKIKNKRYCGHRVSGHSIECDISPDGKYLVSGDSGGELYFYNYSTTAVVHNILIEKDIPNNRLKWHPTLPTVLVAARLDGCIRIFK